MLESHSRPPYPRMQNWSIWGPTVLSFDLSGMSAGGSEDRDNTGWWTLEAMRNSITTVSRERTEGQRRASGLRANIWDCKFTKALCIYWVYQWKALKYAIPTLLVYVLGCCLELGTSFPIETILQIVSLPQGQSTKTYRTLMYLNIVLIMLKTLTIFIRVLLCESAFRVLVPVTYASALGVLRALDLIPTVLNLIRMAPYVVEGWVAFYYYRNQTGIPSNSSLLK